MVRRLHVNIIDHITALAEHPLFNFGTLCLTLSSIANLYIPVFADLDLRQEIELARLDQWLMLGIGLELILRLASHRRRAYIQSIGLGADLASILPLSIIPLAWLASQYLDTKLEPSNWPGFLLFKGTRSLRLLPVIYFFYRKRQTVSLDAFRFSPLKQYFFSGMAGLVFTIVLAIGSGIAVVYSQIQKEGAQHRLQQVRLQANSYGVLQAHLIFEKYILGSWITQGGFRVWIPGSLQNPEALPERFETSRDYQQLDEVQPGQSILINLKDLHQAQRLLELTILLCGFLVILTLLISLNFYMEKYILAPLNRAFTTNQLRLQSEEILKTLPSPQPRNEVTRLVYSIDELYDQLRKPARQEPQEHER